MTSVTFRSWQDDRYLSLWEILSALGSLIENLQWQVQIEELAPGPGESRLETMVADTTLDTRELLDASRGDVQIIDGLLSGFKADEARFPYLTIRAVDSTWWDVDADDEAVIRTLRAHFPRIGMA
jgi:hypothetical protein